MPNLVHVVLVYKRLVIAGGAEKLLVKEYKYLKELGARVTIVTYELNPEVFFGESVSQEDIIVFEGKSSFDKFRSFVDFARANPKSIFLCASGRMETYVVSLLVPIKYAFHIHHPLFMSFNDYDKYSPQLMPHFDEMLASNHGAKRFREIYKQLSFFKRIYIFLHAWLTIKAYRKSQVNFVLSEYSKKEKRLLFEIDAVVERGAFEEDLLNYQPNPVLPEFSNCKNKFLTLGRMDINKRLDELLVAFSQFLENEPSSVLVLGGKGPEEENLRKQADALGIADKVAFVGFIPEEQLFDYLAWPDLFISIDWADYTITTFEPLVFGTKVLVSNERDLDADLMASGYVRLCVPDAIHTLEAMREFLKEEPKLSLKELHKIIERFTWKNYVRRVATYLEKM